MFVGSCLQMTALKDEPEGEVVIVQLMALRELLLDDTSKHLALTHRGVYNEEFILALTDLIHDHLKEYEERYVTNSEPRLVMSHIFSWTCI
jgi:hypothetical protein